MYFSDNPRTRHNTRSNSKYNPRYTVAIISILAGIVILAAKWLAYIYTNSAALKSDALEGVVNVVAAGFSLVAIIYAEKPSDEDHPYGHGKMEHFSAAFEGGLVSLAALLIFYEAAHALLGGHSIKNLGLGLAINAAAGAANGLLGLYVMRRGRALNSHALIADGHHVFSDFITTVGLVAGLLLAQFTGWYWIDSLLALVVGVLLAVTGYKLVRSSAAALLDSESPKTISALVQGLNANEQANIIAVHDLRTMRSGRYTHVDAHIVVPEFLSVKQGHDLVEAYCEDVLRTASIEGEFHSHMDPCMRRYCSQCRVTPCDIRREPFGTKPKFTAEKTTATV